MEKYTCKIKRNNNKGSIYCGLYKISIYNSAGECIFDDSTFMYSYLLFVLKEYHIDESILNEFPIE